MGLSKQRVVVVLGLAGLLAAGVGGPAAARSSRRSLMPPVHYSGKPMLNPKADVPAPLAMEPAMRGAVGAPGGGRIEDPHRFDAWSGYETGRLPEAVTTGDFDGDGAIDVAYAR